MDGGSARNVGDIFYTTRTDSGLGGAVECNGGTYDTRDYTGAGSIGELLRTGKLPYISLSNYAQQITETGYCGCFGWDGGTTTAFRVPLLKDIFIEAAPLSEGQHTYRMRAGLPNITGSIGYAEGVGGVSGAFYKGTPSGGNFLRANSGTQQSTLFNASRSSAIYGSSDTVQPEAVKYRAMVQLFNGTTDEAITTCATVLADVSNLKDHRVVAFQIPTAGNGYTWYRKYADGWVEQGGILSATVTSVTLPVEMTDNNYPVQIFYVKTASTSNVTFQRISTETQTTTGFTSPSAGSDRRWQVSGMAK